jgi:hypothetical protein
MAGESTYASISSLVANIYEGALLVASENSVMTNLVTNYRDSTSMTPRVFSNYTGGTIVSLAEISDLTAQTFNPAASGTITPALFGQQYYLGTHPACRSLPACQLCPWQLHCRPSP